MIEEYAKVGYQALVYWETELRDPVRRAEIIQEIVAFVRDCEDD
jgi:G:T-mismatch repair DNA endonuclease (very short patch repair protein)